MHWSEHRRLEERGREAAPQILTGQFLLSPVGWFPRSDPHAAVSVSFASLSHEREAEPVIFADGALLFSTN